MRLSLVQLIRTTLVTLSCLSASSSSPSKRTYKFVVSRDIRVVGDRTLVVNTVNGKVDERSPAIHVREGDTLSVLLVNQLPDYGMSIHWHGLTMENAKHFDGTVGVTQCAVAPGESFLYEFVVQQAPGTYWWHANTSPQPVGHDFVRGPFIIHPRDTDISKLTEDFYQWDNETVLFFQEEFLSYPLEDYRDNMGAMSAASDRDIDGTRISIFPWRSGLLNGKTTPGITISNGKAKFRIINGGLVFAYIFSIDGHELTVVAADGEPVEPYKTDALYLHVGERFDVTVNFDIRRKSRNVWVRARTLDEQKETGILGVLQIRRDESVRRLSKAWPTTQPLDRTKGRLLNCVHVKETDNCFPITVLQPIRKRKVLKRDIHVIDFLWVPPPHSAHMISIDKGTWTQNILPQKALLMSSTTTDDLYDNTLILPLKLNRSVTFVIRSRPTFVHAFHIHGYKFEVLEVIRRTDKTCADSICNLVNMKTAFSTRIKKLSKRKRTGVLKDTVIIPAGGAVVIRLNTVNSGVWLAHCPISMHLMDGFSLVLDVGGYRESSFPADWPSCDPKGRLQTYPTAECWCKADENVTRRRRMGNHWRCSRPHLCRHGQQVYNKYHSF